MPTAKDLNKKPIYSVTDGTKLGEIKDIYLDADATQIVAVLVGKEGVFTKTMLVIRRSDVRTIGVDCWLAHGEAEVMDLKDVDGFEDLQLVTDLRKREMETTGGTKIGTVGDVAFDDDDSVVGFALAKVHVQGPVAAAKQVALSAVTSFGDKHTAMMVDLQAAETAANDAE
jgi:uncharacterized protein YrrD